MKLILSITILLIVVSACSENNAQDNAQQEGTEINDLAQIEKFKHQADLKIKQLSNELKIELSSSMQDGGPLAAVKTCKLKAPEIAHKLSNHLSIKRTSLKLRNTANAPDTWEQKVLESFEKQLASGLSADQLVYSEKITTDNGASFRLMRAIPTQGLCLTCHGDKQTMSEGLVNALQENYPNDLATGYQLGQIRGAFSVIQIINN